MIAAIRSLPQVAVGGGATPVFVAASVPSVFVSPVTVNVPGGTANGDFMVLIGMVPNTATITTPSGWTLHGSFPLDHGTGSQRRMYLFHRVASSEPASYSVTSSANARYIMASYSGCSGIDAVATAVQSGGASEPLMPSVTTTGTNRRVLAAYSWVTSVNWTAAPAGYTNRAVSEGANHRGVLDDKEYASAGATGTAQADTVSTVSWVAAHIALKP